MEPLFYDKYQKLKMIVINTGSVLSLMENHCLTADLQNT